MINTAGAFNRGRNLMDKGNGDFCGSLGFVRADLRVSVMVRTGGLGQMIKQKWKIL